MKPSLLLVSALIALLGAIGNTRVDAIDGATERKALRKATGVYGRAGKNKIPTGVFRGTVGNSYHEHASMRLMLRKGRGKSKAKLYVWDGVNHSTRFVRLNAKVRQGGRKIILSRGRVTGKGHLPLGIEIKRGSLTGKVAVKRKLSFVGKFRLGGIDLANGNAPVNGRATFRGKK